jgi:D-alanyl-D-alanine carboxypeptidase/D-alanyl-D-alanine-endopeptidase (penicillin-binding protein 4)
VNWFPGTRHELDCAGLTELGYVESRPLKELAREVQKASQNLYTDLLLAHVGEARCRVLAHPEETSAELGLRELKAFSVAGLPADEVILEEGSGLSRNNLASPGAIVALLLYMTRHPAAEAYLEALPIAGVDGTLRNRLTDPPAAGNLRAKTGTLRWAHCLSGCVTSAAGERLVFSIMLNRYQNSDPAAPPARDELDAIARLLAGFGGRSNL